MSVGIPIKLLHEASPHIVTVEMRTGDIYRGTLSAVEDNMNVQLRRVTQTRRDGKVSNLEHVFIRGSKIRFFILPDILASAPMFKRVEALKEGRPMEARGLGRGRGVPGVASRGKAGGSGGKYHGFSGSSCDNNLLVSYSFLPPLLVFCAIRLRLIVFVSSLGNLLNRSRARYCTWSRSKGRTLKQ